MAYRQAKHGTAPLNTPICPLYQFSKPNFSLKNLMVVLKLPRDLLLYMIQDA